MRNGVLILILLLSFAGLQGQNNYHFIHYSVEDGLSQGNILQINQDDRGFIWINTTNGLNRFDGRNFLHIFPSEDSTTVKLPHQITYDFLEDNNGKYWIGTRNGLSKYDPVQETFTNFTKVGDCEGCLVGMLVRKLVEDPPYIWIGTSAGHSRIHSETNEIESWYYTDGTDNITQLFSVRDMELLDTGEVLMGTDEGIAIYMPQTDTFRYFYKEDGLLHNFVESIYRDSDGSYWLGYSGGSIAKVAGDWNQPVFHNIEIKFPGGKIPHIVFDMQESIPGEMWFCTNEGVMIWDTKSNSRQFLTHDESDPYSISSNEIKNIFKDDNGRIWLGSNIGIDLYDPYLNQFELLRDTGDKKTSLAANNSTAIFEDSFGYVWIGHEENGITVIPSNPSPEQYYYFASGDMNTNISGNSILSIAEDHLNRIWVATTQGVDIINWPDRSQRNYQIERVHTGSVSENKLPASYVYSIQKDDENNMWLSVRGKGLISVSPHGKMKQYKYRDSVHGLLSRNYISSFGLDSDHSIWIGVQAVGPCILNNSITDSTFVKLKGGKILRDSPAADFFIDDESIIIGTNDGAFLFPNKKHLRDSVEPPFRRFSKSNGLSNNTVTKILAGRQNEYWLSTGNGISVINTLTNSARSYEKIAGAKNFQFNAKAGVLTRDSLIYFGGTKGVLRFNPFKFNQNSTAPKVYLKKLKILNADIPVSPKANIKNSIPRALAFMEELTLKPKDKIISFYIDAINFTLAEETQYAYKLEGFKEEWLYTDQPSITYTNLDPGTYTLYAKASNNEGIWSEEATLQLTMLPPWWRTWWAYLLYLLFVVGVVYLILKLRLQQERRLELARSAERERFRKRSSQDFHDEAGTKITRIALITELAKQSSNNNTQLEEYLDQIDENLQELNIGMRDFIWALDPAKDNTHDTLSRFVEFAGKFCEQAGIQFKSQHIPDNLKSRVLNMADRRHLLLILKEALNNAVKHSKASIIEFKASNTSSQLVITLKDNGIGFNSENVTGGNGLINMKARADMIGAAIDLVAKPKQGTTLILELQTTQVGN